MAVPFVSRKRSNPRDLDADGKFYPAPAYISEVNVNKLAEEISESTTLTPTEVVGVIRSLLFKLGFRHSCKGWEKASQVTANDIDDVKVIFSPETMLKDKLKKPEFVKIDAKYLPADDEEKSGESSNQAETQDSKDSAES